MTPVKIISLIVLAAILCACFLSEKLAAIFEKTDEDRQKKLSLMIKGGSLAVGVVMFLLFFVR